MLDERSKPFFLRGAFTPVTDEITVEDLEVRGALPPELDGLYLKNGPNPKTGTSPDWLFGDGMVHGVRLEQGRATSYRNRYVRTARFAGETGAGIRGGGVSNTHVLAHAGRILSFVENTLPMELDRNLETKGAWDFFGGVDMPFTAHAKICPATGELVGFGYQWKSPHLVLYRIDREGRVAERRIIDVPAPSYLHDFALTEHYAVFFDTPARMVAEWGGGVMPFAWREGEPTRIGVVPREGGETRWFDAAPCHLAHTANAFERDGHVVIDAERTDRFPGIPKLHRWDVDLKRGVVTEHPFEGRIAGFPRVDERRTGKPYRYAYVVEFEMGPLGPSGSHLRRYDVEARTSVAKDFGGRYAVAECVFAPSGRSAEEDDGWLLFFRYDTEQDRSDLVVLDARDFGGEPVAVVALPRRVPMGIHGSWVPDAALAAPR